MNTQSIRLSKVLLQLSGGKDSIACLILLKEQGVDVEAIHFVHHYGYELPTRMSKMACDQLGVVLHTIDMTKEIEELFLDNFNGRPCRFCKSIMDQITVDFAQAGGFDAICVGDTKEDSMLINRIIELEGEADAISRYLNPKVSMPDGLVIYRPLINKDSSYTLDMVTSRFPSFHRVNDTGDKYFEYSREGCPLQFKDLGARYTKKMMGALKTMNQLCSEFATQKGIKASIHLPSEVIVTIPDGYEDECRSFLIKNGCKLKKKPADINIHVYSISIRLETEHLGKDIMEIAISRFSERLNMRTITECNYGDFIKMRTESTTISAIYDRSTSLVTIIIHCPEEKFSVTSIRNICLEIFHTRKSTITHSILK